MILTLTIAVVSGCYLKEPCARVIEIDENASLCDLHLAIQRAVAFGNDHPYTFYAGRYPWHRKRWFANPELDWYAQESVWARTRLSRIYPLSGMKLYYWFDFGDQWLFEIRKSRKANMPDAAVTYPRVVAREGPNPTQYPRWE